MHDDMELRRLPLVGQGQCSQIFIAIGSHRGRWIGFNTIRILNVYYDLLPVSFKLFYLTFHFNLTQICLLSTLSPLRTVSSIPVDIYPNFWRCKPYI